MFRASKIFMSKNEYFQDVWHFLSHVWGKIKPPKAERGESLIDIWDVSQENFDFLFAINLLECGGKNIETSPDILWSISAFLKGLMYRKSSGSHIIFQFFLTIYLKTCASHTHHNNCPTVDYICCNNRRAMNCSCALDFLCSHYLNLRSRSTRELQCFACPQMVLFISTTYSKL